MTDALPEERHKQSVNTLRVLSLLELKAYMPCQIPKLRQREFIKMIVAFRRYQRLLLLEGEVIFVPHCFCGQESVR